MAGMELSYEGNPSQPTLRARLRFQSQVGTWVEAKGIWASSTEGALFSLVHELGDRYKREINARTKEDLHAEATQSVIAELTRENERLRIELLEVKDELAVTQSSTYGKLVEQHDALLIERNWMIEQLEEMTSNAASVLDWLQKTKRGT